MDPNGNDAIAGPPDTGNPIPASAGAPRGMTRRQLGLLFAGVTGLLVSGAGYGIVAKTTTDARATASTSFGSLRVLRAGRFARLAANGMPSALRGREALAAMEGGLRVPLASPAGAASLSGHSEHGGQPGGSTTPDIPGNSVPGLRWRQPANSTWGDIVLTEFEVRNDAEDPLAFSPAQLRLVLGASGASVTAQDSAADPAPLAPGAMARLWVSYLAPESANDFFLEFTDPWAGSTTTLALPGMITMEA
jgi:hypothetical protein